MKIDVLSERIAEAILADNILTKKHIVKRIKSILLVWFPAMSRSFKSDRSEVEILRDLEDKKIQMMFWKDKARNLMTKDQIQKSYKEIDNIMIDLGHKL